jgi:hypothetical protein
MAWNPSSTPPVLTKTYRSLADPLIAQGRLSEAEQVLSLLKEQEYFDYVRRAAAEASSVEGHANLTPEENVLPGQQHSDLCHLSSGSAKIASRHGTEEKPADRREEFPPPGLVAERPRHSRRD